MATSMDERAPSRILILAVVALALGACVDDGTKPASGIIQSGGGFSCELPGAGWIRDLYPTSGFLLLKHPDVENEISPTIFVYEDRPRTREELEGYRRKSLSERKTDDSFTSEPLKEVLIGGRKGILIDETSMNALAAGMRHRSTPPPPPVLTRQQTVYVSGPARPYAFTYEAPVSIFEKHRPEFEKLLASIKFAP